MGRVNAPPSGSPPSVGSLIPVRLLGSGGMGEVWLARDEALGVDRAVKRLLPERAGDAALRARFVAEARTLAALGDVPGVVRVHAAGEDPATHLPFFVMDAILLSPERVRAVCARRLGLPPAAAEAVVRSHFGSRAESPAQTAPFTLQDALGSEADDTARQLPERAVLALAREIAAALAALHGHAPPVVHRDLKPSNLLFAADGRLLLADFGVAKTLDKAHAGLTRNGVQPGTQRYAAPELRRGAPATPAADWYSLGIVLYRALTSSFPEWGADFPTHEGLHPFSPLWEPLLRDLLNPDPDRRLADRAELERRLVALERLLDTPRRPARRVWIAAGVAATVVPAALLAVIVASGRARSPSTPPAPAMESRVEGAESVSPAESAENAESAPVSGRARSPSAPPASAVASPAESVEAVAPAESAENAEPAPVSGRARSPSAPPVSAVVSPAESVESVSPAERAETSSETSGARMADSPPTGSRGYIRDDAHLTPQSELVAQAVQSDNLREFEPSMRRKLKLLLPIENPLDDGGLPPGHDAARREQARWYGERIVKSYREHLEVLYDRHLAGDEPSPDDLAKASIPFDEWRAWVVRQDAAVASPAKSAESVSPAERAEASLGEAGLRLESAESGDDILDAVREFLPAVDRIVEEHGVLLPDWNLPVSQFEANPAAREYRLIMARRALDRAERLRRKAEAGEQLYDSDFSQGIVTRAEWEAWLARRRAEESAARKIPPASPESGTKEPFP